MRTPPPPGNTSAGIISVSSINSPMVVKDFFVFSSKYSREARFSVKKKLGHFTLTRRVFIKISGGTFWLRVLLLLTRDMLWAHKSGKFQGRVEPGCYLCRVRRNSNWSRVARNPRQWVTPEFGFYFPPSKYLFSCIVSVRMKKTSTVVDVMVPESRQKKPAF